ncbi:MAG: hypothetical protein ACK4IW_01540 [Brevundimonas aurantiaca]|jgi:hypothetical protein|tara:strand:+ start:911 stop:1222 length:312 start_codon:yes stop_codon:yes gene_type:complete
MTHNPVQNSQLQEGRLFLIRLGGRLLAIVGMFFVFNLILAANQSALSPSTLAGLTTGLGAGQLLFGKRRFRVPSMVWQGVGSVMILVAATASYGLAKAAFGGN